MHPAWKKRSPYRERYRQRTKTCNVQVSCTARAHVAISCGKFRLDSTYVTSSRGVAPHRCGFDFLLRLRKLRFESEKRLALRGRTMRTGERRAGEREREREREREKEKTRTRSIYCTGCSGCVLPCRAYCAPNFESNSTSMKNKSHSGRPRRISRVERASRSRFTMERCVQVVFAKINKRRHRVIRRTRQSDGRYACPSSIGISASTVINTVSSRVSDLASAVRERNSFRNERLAGRRDRNSERCRREIAGDRSSKYYITVMYALARVIADCDATQIRVIV